MIVCPRQSSRADLPRCLAMLGDNTSIQRAQFCTEASQNMSRLQHHSLVCHSNSKLQAGLENSCTEKEVHQLEGALKLLIYRAGSIYEAQLQRSKKSSLMIHMDENQIPKKVMVNCPGSIAGGAALHYAKQDELKQAQLSPKSKVWLYGLMPSF